MNHLLNISRSGINGLQKKLDVTSHNIANVNTTGYKEQKMSFKELLANPILNNQAPITADAQTSIYRGVRAEDEHVNFQQGAFTSTGNQWDLALEGEGFFGIRDENNQLTFTRDGSFGLDQTGRLVNSQGRAVDMVNYIPENNWPKGSVNIDQLGNVSIKSNNEQQTLVGKINVYQPGNTNQLQAIGDGQFQLIEGGQAQLNNQPFKIRQGSLEQSNVNMAQTMTDLIVTQRAYSLNTKVLQSTDDLLSITNRFTD